MCGALGCLVSAFAVLLALAASAHQDDEERTVRIVWTTTPPVVDGVLDEAVWQQGALLSPMTQIQPNFNQPASQRTEDPHAHGRAQSLLRVLVLRRRARRDHRPRHAARELPDQRRPDQHRPGHVLRSPQRRHVPHHRGRRPDRRADRGPGVPRGMGHDLVRQDQHRREGMVRGDRHPLSVDQLRSQWRSLGAQRQPPDRAQRGDRSLGGHHAGPGHGQRLTRWDARGHAGDPTGYGSRRRALLHTYPGG